MIRCRRQSQQISVADNELFSGDQASAQLRDFRVKMDDSRVMCRKGLFLVM